MHVCMLTYYYWPVKAGGTVNQCRRLVAQLINNGISCEVLTSRYDINVPSIDLDNSITIRRKPTFEVLLQILHLKSRGSDAIHTAGETAKQQQRTKASGRKSTT